MSPCGTDLNMSAVRAQLSRHCWISCFCIVSPPCASATRPSGGRGFGVDVGSCNCRFPAPAAVALCQELVTGFAEPLGRPGRLVWVQPRATRMGVTLSGYRVGPPGSARMASEANRHSARQSSAWRTLSRSFNLRSGFGAPCASDRNCPTTLLQSSMHCRTCCSTVTEIPP